jgi:transcriptional regulator with XRE-family HTH domain
MFLGDNVLNLLQELLSDRLRRGATFREIERECGVSHVNLSRYHKGKDPDSKNLVKLATFFGVDFHDLLDERIPSKGNKFSLGTTLEDQLAYQEWQTLSPDEKLEAVRMLRRLKEGRKNQDQGK